MGTSIKNSIFWIALLCMMSCSRGEPNISETPISPEPGNKQISISCASPLQKILLHWIKDFNQSHPNIKVSVQDSNYDFLLLSESRVIEMKDTISWRVSVMREGIIPIISENNPYLNMLEKQGISKEELKKIFTGEQISWGEILRNDASEKVTVFLPEEGRGYNRKLADFLEIDAELLQGKRFSSKQMLLDAIRQNPYIVAVLNACCAYDPETNERVDGIAALAIDINNNGSIDSKEEISDKLCDFERAVYLGLLPPQLCSCIFLQADQAPVNTEQKVFIKWILTEGQKHVVDHGFSIIRHSTAVKAIQDLEAKIK